MEQIYNKSILCDAFKQGILTSKRNYIHFPITLMQGVYDGSVDRIEFLLQTLTHQLYSKSIEIKNKTGSSLEESFDSAAEEYGVSFMFLNKNRLIQNGKIIYESTIDNKVFASLNNRNWIAFLEEDKTDFEWKCLVAHTALKSIIGKKKYCKTNKKLLFARMNGLARGGDCKNINLSEYKFIRIINELKDKWHLSYWSHHERGFNFSYSISTKELSIICLKKKEKFKKKESIRQKQRLLKDFQEKFLS